MRFDVINGAILGLVASTVTASQYDGDNCGGVKTVYVTIARPAKAVDTGVGNSATVHYPNGQYPTVDVPVAVISSNSPATMPVVVGSSSVTTSTENLTSTLYKTVVITNTFTRADPTNTTPAGYGSGGPENVQAASSGHDNLGPSVNTELTFQGYTLTISDYVPHTTSEADVVSTESPYPSDDVVYVYETISVIPVQYTPTPASSVQATSTSTSSITPVIFSEIKFSTTPAFTFSSTTLSFVFISPTSSSTIATSTSIDSSAASSGAVATLLVPSTGIYPSTGIGGWNSTSCTGPATKISFSSGSGNVSFPNSTLNTSRSLLTADFPSGVHTVSKPSTFSVESRFSATISSATRSVTVVYPTVSIVTVVEPSDNSSSVAIVTIPLGYGPVVVPSNVASSSSATPRSSAGGALEASSLASSISSKCSDKTSSTSSSELTSGSTAASSMPGFGTTSATEHPASFTDSSKTPSSIETTAVSSSSSLYPSSGSSILTFMTSTTTSPLTSSLGSSAKFTSADSSSSLSATSSSASPTSCGSRGGFTLDFDDLPPLAAPTDTADPMPIFSPYHQFYFGIGFVIVPPPTDPYLPASGKLLLQYIPVLGGNNTGQVGNGYTETSGCFNFNARGASFGCDSKGPECNWEITGLRYNFDTKVEEQITMQKLSTPSCPALVDCSLVPVSFDETFKNLTSLLIKGTVAGIDKIWWMDSVNLSWFDNSCSRGLCRQRFHK